MCVVCVCVRYLWTFMGIIAHDCETCQSNFNTFSMVHVWDWDVLCIERELDIHFRKGVRQCDETNVSFDTKVKVKKVIFHIKWFFTKFGSTSTWEYILASNSKFLVSF